MPSTSIGHGRLGFTSGLPIFADLSTPVGPRPIIAIVKPASEAVPGLWSASSGAYIAAWSIGYDQRDVVAVRTSTEDLTRASSEAEVQATEGTFYYDPEAATKYLWVHLTDDADPADTTVMAHLAFCYSNEDVAHPTLGEEITVGTFSTSTSGSGFSNGTSTTIYMMTGDLTSRTLVSTGGAGYAQAAYQFTGLVVGAKYRFSGGYRIDATKDAFAQAVLTLRIENSGGDLLDADGRSFGAAAPFTVTVQPYEWRRWIIDFVCPTTTMNLKVRLSTTDKSATAYIDGERMQRIFRYEAYEQRLVVGAAPELSAGTNGVYFGARTMASLELQVANGDGALDQALGDLTWESAPVDILVGGSGTDGQEVTIEDMFQQFKGYAQDHAWDEDIVSLTVESARYDFHRDLPLRTYDDNGITGGVEVAAFGKARPMLFGDRDNLKPYRINVYAEGKYGTYEVADCDRAPNGIKSIDNVYAFESLEAAQVGWYYSGDKIDLVEGDDYTADLGNGTVVILRDVGPYRVNEDRRYINLWASYSPGEESPATTRVFTVTLDTGLYTAAGLAAEIQDKLDDLVSAGVTGTLTCTYDESTNLFTIARAGSTKFVLLTKSGTNKGIWDLIGFPQEIDMTPGWVVTTSANDTIYWVEGATSKTSTLTAGTYATGKDMAAQIETQLNAVASTNVYRVDYNESTAKFKIRRESGTDTFDLTWATSNAGDDLGFGTDSMDSKTQYESIEEVYQGAYVSSISHEGITPTFEDADKNHLIIVNATGYKDDASGTYTGTANAAIEKAPDVARCIAERWLNIPVDKFNLASFAAARTTCPQPLGVFIAEVTSSQIIFQKIEDSVLGRIEVFGDGGLRFLTTDGTTPDGARDVTEEDLIGSPRMDKVTDELYGEVRIRYNETYWVGTWFTSVAADDEVATRFRRRGSLERDTYLRDTTDADAIAARYLSIAQRPTRKFEITTGPKLMGIEIGDVITLTTPRAPVSGGAYSAQAMRVIGFRKAATDGLVSVALVENEEV